MNKGWLLQEIGRAIGASIKGTFDRQYGPGEGMCPDWLAAFLGAAGLAFLFTIVAYGFWSMSR